MTTRVKTITIHIGHHKTGSSAIQAFLGQNIQLVEKFGIVYPLSDEFIKRSKKNEITSGNWRELEGLLPSLNKDNHFDYLFSSELFFDKFLDEAFRVKLIQNAARCGYKVKVICYTRDYFEFMFSGWGQYIKRSGGSQNFYDFIMQDNKFHSTLNGSCFDILLKIIEFSENEGFELKIYNYDRYKYDGLVEHFLANLPQKVVLSKEHLNSINIVNRSLTHAEYEIQRQFNLHFGKNCNKFISDPLVQECPNEKPDIPFITQAQYYDIVKKKNSVLNLINDRLKLSERIEITEYSKLSERYTMIDSDRYYLNERQIQVLAKAISEELQLGLNINPWRFIFYRALRWYKRWK